MVRERENFIITGPFIASAMDLLGSVIGHYRPLHRLDSLAARSEVTARAVMCNWPGVGGK